MATVAYDPPTNRVSASVTFPQGGAQTMQPMITVLDQVFMGPPHYASLRQGMTMKIAPGSLLLPRGEKGERAPVYRPAFAVS